MRDSNIIESSVAKKTEADSDVASSKAVSEKTEGKRLGVVKGLILSCLGISVTTVILIAAVMLMIALLGGEEVSVEQGDNEEKQEIVLEVTQGELNVISVVEENMDSVVSIAVSNLAFTPNGGVVDSTNNIGSGFVVDESGLIITNQHVVEDPNVDYEVVTTDGQSYDVVEVVRDEVNDIALVRIEDAQNLNAVDLGNSEALKQGQTVIAIGTPLGEYAGSITTGVISGLNRSVTTSSNSFFGPAKTFEDVIQTDAAINPGNSGGPLLNSQGEVIGVNFATSAGADNISFALPIERVVQRLDEYRKFGRFIKPYIGVEYQLISEADARYFSDLVPGALVRRVVDGSPAASAGLQQGDIITKIEGQDVESSFVNILQKYSVGETVTLEVLRDGDIVEVEVELGELG